MKRAIATAAIVSFVFVMSCGGGGSSNGGTQPAVPTTAQTKAVAGASIGQTAAATSAALSNAMINILPSVSASAKSVTETGDVNYTYTCALAGVAVATGTISLTCIYNAGGSCTATNQTLQVDFQDCQVTENVDGVDYTVTLNNTVNTTASGTGTGDESGLTSLEFNGTVSGTVDVTGDIEGTANLSNISYQGSGVPPTVTCSGTASVTTDVTETCTVNSDCSGCVQ